MNEKHKVDAGFWVHGVPARNIDQVVSYLTGDAHDQSKVQFYKDGKFYSVVLED